MAARTFAARDPRPDVDSSCSSVACCARVFGTAPIDFECLCRSDSVGGICAGASLGFVLPVARFKLNAVEGGAVCGLADADA